MSDFIEYDPEDFEDPELPEPDPALIAKLDQDGAAFAAARGAFRETYGFDHDCRCAQDYAEGKLETVTECYLKMVGDALDTCARLNWENQTLQGMVSGLIEMNNKLLDQLPDADAFIVAELENALGEEPESGNSNAQDEAV